MRFLELLGGLLVAGALGIGVYYALLNIRWGYSEEKKEDESVRRDSE
jgi:hypothetical protein